MNLNLDLGLGDALKAIADVVLQYRDRIEVARERKLDQVLDALHLLDEIAGLHVKAVVHVCVPVLDRDDIVATARLYQQLVDNPDFPIGYGLAKGVLTEAYGMKEFNKPSLHERIAEVLVQVHRFQTAGFMLGYGSDVAADSLRVAADLYTLAGHLETGAAEDHDARERLRSLRAEACDRFGRMFYWLAMQETGQHVNAPAPDASSSADVVRLGQEWARQWKRYVQSTLYGGHGLHYAIGQLRMATLG